MTNPLNQYRRKSLNQIRTDCLHSIVTMGEKSAVTLTILADEVVDTLRDVYDIEAETDIVNAGETLIIVLE